MSDDTKTITITLEDLPDGSLLMQSDPPMDSLLQAAQQRPDTLTPAEAMGVVVWDALLHAARRMARDRHADLKASGLGQPAAVRH